jgi:type VI secretion system protein ImpM
MDAAVGWYGKLPSLGDFAQRRLPRAFVEDWDDWLQQCLQASRAALDSDWMAHYLGAPVWRFVLLPGVIGTDAWAGVLLPSVDRVGRYFPLTVCARLPGCAPFGSSLAAIEHWLDELAACALLGLDAGSGHLRLEAALRELVRQTVPASCQTMPTHQAETGMPAGFLDALAARLLPQLLAGKSVWWCVSPDKGCTGFSCQGLPAPTDFATLLCGKVPAAPAQAGPGVLNAIHRNMLA